MLRQDPQRPSRSAATALALSAVVLAAVAIAVGPGSSALDLLDADVAAAAASGAGPIVDLTNLAGSLPVWAASLAILWAVGTARSWPLVMQGVAVGVLA